MGRLPHVGPLLLLLMPALAMGCSSSGDDDAATDLALVSNVQCSITRGSFVAKSTASPAGEVSVTCPSVRGVLFNGAVIPGDALTSFTVKPNEGVNILHVEQGDGDAATATDIPFMFGTFQDANAFIPNAIAIRTNAPGLSDNGQLVLPLPAGPSALNLSQLGTQILRDKGNVLGRYDGTGKDVSGLGFHAGVKVIHSSYDPSNLSVILTPRAGGVHVEAAVHSVSTQIGWDAGVNIITFNDQVTASVDTVAVSADLDLHYDAGSHKIQAGLASTHTVHVEGVNLDSAALDRVPLGIADGLESVLSDGAEALANNFGDPLLDVIRDTLAPAIALSLEQLKLPSQVTIPAPIGGTIGIAQNFDGAAFDGNGLQLSLAAKVTAPNPSAIAAPGWLTRVPPPAPTPTFDTAPAFGASISIDYVNQALFAAWKQGILNRQLSGPISQFGVSTDAIMSEAKMPPIVFPSADGKGLTLNIGEFELTTVFHSPNTGDAHVRVSVTVLAGADITLGPNGETLVVKPNHDDANTHFIAELIGVEQGKQPVADELAGILTQFSPVIESTIADSFDLPPIAIPAIDLGLVAPGFAGEKGSFDGTFHFDAAGSRIGLDGKLMAK